MASFGIGTLLAKFRSQHAYPLRCIAAPVLSVPDDVYADEPFRVSLRVTRTPSGDPDPCLVTTQLTAVGRGPVSVEPAVVTADLTHSTPTWTVVASEDGPVSLTATLTLRGCGDACPVPEGVSATFRVHSNRNVDAATKELQRLLSGVTAEVVQDSPLKAGRSGRALLQLTVPPMRSGVDLSHLELEVTSTSLTDTGHRARRPVQPSGSVVTVPVTATPPGPHDLELNVGVTLSGRSGGRDLAHPDAVPVHVEVAPQSFWEWLTGDPTGAFVALLTTAAAVVAGLVRFFRRRRRDRGGKPPRRRRWLTASARSPRRPTGSRSR